MSDLDRVDSQIAAIEELEAYRARLKRIDAGEPANPIFGPNYADKLRRVVADLEAKVASLRKE